MREPTYRDSLIHGWYLMLDHKILWIFGLFAALLGQMGVLEIFTKVIVTAKYYTYYPLIMSAPEITKGIVSSLQEWNLPLDKGVWLIWLLVIFLAFAFVFLFVAVVSQGALIHCVHQFVRGKSKLASHEAWHAGVGHFGRLLFLQVIKKIVLSILLFFTGYATYHFILTPSPFFTTLFAFSILVALFFGSIISLLTTYAAGYIVVEEYQVENALSEAWKLLRSHSLVSLEVASIILLMNVVVTLVAACAVILFKFQLALVGIFALATNSLALWSVGNTFSALILTGILVVLGSFITVFSTSVWTYLFMKMHETGLQPRMKLLVQRLFSRA